VIDRMNVASGGIKSGHGVWWIAAMQVTFCSRNVWRMI
jgi:hypothetical protein